MHVYIYIHTYPIYGSMLHVRMYVCMYTHRKHRTAGWSSLSLSLCTYCVMNSERFILSPQMPHSQQQLDSLLAAMARGRIPNPLLPA